MGGYIYTPDNGQEVRDSNPLPIKTMNKNQSSSSSWTITNGTSISTNNINFEGKLLAALIIPVGYVGGNITFQSSDSASGTYYDVYDIYGNQISVTASANRIIPLTGTALQAIAGLQYLKIKTTSNVSANTTISVVQKG